MKPVASGKRWKRRVVISPSFVVGRGWVVTAMICPEWGQHIEN